MFKLLRLFIVGAFVTSATSAFAASDRTLVATNAVWRLFPGTTDPSPGAPTGWTQRGFDDSTWQSTPATFFYGEPGFSGTDLTGMSGQYSTIFLRHEFNVASPTNITDLELSAICDDGFVAYLNGARIVAANANPGDPTYDSFSAANVGEPISYQSYPIANPTDALIDGENVLAVVVLNTSLSSSDLVFAASLTATDATPTPPTLVAVNPPPGLVTNLTQIVVTFSEPVTGVTAADFLVNDSPATAMTGNGAKYSFTFPQPPAGLVTIGWGPLHQIKDLDVPPVAFSGTAPGSSWAYELLDPAGPGIASRVPAPGTTLRSLGAVEVMFNRPVSGVDSADLTLNGHSAIQLTGIGAGPYRFTFNPGAATGTATVAWAAGHGITSDEPVPHPFLGSNWTYSINPAMPIPDLVINEFLADNQMGKQDEDADPEDWIELWNRGTTSVDIGGWALSDGKDTEDEWVLPSVVVPANGYLLVWTSGKDRAGTGPRGELHTHFKLNPNGDALRLLSPELPRLPLDTVEFGEQGSDFSYGRQREGDAWVWRYFSTPTPGSANVASSITNKTTEVHFSVERGYYDSPFRLSLACETPGATIRYTTNGGLPVSPNGFVYSAPILINSSRVIRAAAVAPDRLPSPARTHTYLYGLTTQRRSLPALSLVTATNNLFGRTGIMEYNPRNTDKHGPAWERPISVEYIRPEDNGGFQVNAGVRIQGGGYIRGIYNYRTTSLPESKYSFRLYFRGEYGEGRLNYPLFPTTTVESFDTIVLRAGMNDHSNPFLKDEYARQLGADLGQPASHGTFVHLFLNGVYKGYYNPTERIDADFLQAYHGGGDRWDINAQFGEVREGDGSSWNQLLNLAQTRPATNAANFQEFARRVDLTNFVDYLLPNIYIDTDDWPHNNWRAARESSPNGRWRFYMWDAEFSFGQPNGHPTTFNTINGQLSSLSPPWGTTEVQRIFNALKRSREFQILFADRVHRAFFNDGSLTDARLRARYEETKARLNATRTVSGFNNSMINNWINGRRRSVLTHLNTARFNGSSNAPGFGQFGGAVPLGYSLVITNVSGSIYYTTDGTDPRLAFTEAIAPSAQTYSAPLILTTPLRLRARSLEGTTNWSALTEASFQIAEVGMPIRISELMYNPPGGDSYEFIELTNLGGISVDVSGFSLEGVTFRFPVPFPALGPGAHLVLASDENPAAFSVRYPGVVVAGYYTGALSNGGERIALLDRDGRVIESVTYGDGGAWSTAADGGGASLERGALNGDPDSGASWHGSQGTGGSPGAANSNPIPPSVRLNEVSAQPEPGLDWIELHNSGAQPIALKGWSLTDDPGEPRKFVFDSNSQIPGGGFLLVYCDPATSVAGLKASFGLDFGGEQVALFDSHTNVVDVLAFGPQALGFATGRIGSEDEWQLTEPTPSAANEPATSGPLDEVVINEFLADSDAGDDWIEFHNPASLPVTLTGAYLGTSNTLFRIAAPTFVGPGDFTVVTADERPGPGHVDFKLPAEGGMIALYDSNGRTVNRVDYARQLPAVTIGRLPDATGSMVTLPFSATPGASNYLATPGATLQFSEFMARNTTAVSVPGGGVADWFELNNGGTNTLALGGFKVRLNEDPGWTLPGNISLVPNARLLIWATSRVLPAGNLNIGRELPDQGGVLTLTDDRGRLLDSVAFGFQLPDQSVGRAPEGWMLLAAPTPAFPNAGPAILSDSSKVRFNEWLVVSLNNGEWLELFNPELNPINLSGHYLTDDPSASGITQFAIAPLSYVSAGGFVRFLADGNPDLGPDHLSFRLDQWGETIRLSDPAKALIDQVDFVVQAPEVSEGRLPDGTSRITRLPWLSPLASNSRDDLDLDDDGLPDVWEFGFNLNPDDSSDAILDNDGDGWTNAQEFAAGTNPQNAASFFEAHPEMEGAAVHIRFIAVANHTYSVLFRDGQLDSDTWQKLDDVPTSDATREAVVTDLSPGELRPVRFYRVVTPASQ